MQNCKKEKRMVVKAMRFTDFFYDVIRKMEALKAFYDQLKVVFGYKKL
jgi:hypothetical protein